VFRRLLKAEVATAYQQPRLTALLDKACNLLGDLRNGAHDTVIRPYCDPEAVAPEFNLLVVNEYANNERIPWHDDDMGGLSAMTPQDLARVPVLIISLQGSAVFAVIPNKSSPQLWAAMGGYAQWTKSKTNMKGRGAFWCIGGTSCS